VVIGSSQRIFVRRKADGRTRDKRLADAGVKPGKAGDKRGPFAVMLDDDDPSEPAKRAGKGHAPTPRCHHLRAGPGAEGEPPRWRLSRSDGAETGDEAAGDGQDIAARPVGWHGRGLDRRDLCVGGTCRAQHRAGQPRQRFAQCPRLTQPGYQRSQILRLFGQCQRALRLAVGLADGGARIKALAGFQRDQLAPLCLESNLTGTQLRRGQFGPALQLARAIDLGAERRRSLADLWQHGLEDRPHVHRVLDRTRSQQRQRRRAPRQSLQGCGQPHQRLLTLGQAGAQDRLFAGDQPGPCIRLAHFRLGLLDSRCDRRRFAGGAIGLGGGAGGLGLERFGAGPER
jgi:hypothetical protein